VLVSDLLVIQALCRAPGINGQFVIGLSRSKLLFSSRIKE